MNRFDDPEERRRMAETLRLAAEAIESGFGETFDLRLEPHHHEEQLGRVNVLRRSGAERVTIHVTFVADRSLLKARLPPG